MFFVTATGHAVVAAPVCHRYHYWAYKTPQHCGGVYARAAQTPRPTAQPSKDDVTEKVTIEITITSELLETWAREDALEKIKGELK